MLQNRLLGFHRNFVQRGMCFLLIAVFFILAFSSCAPSKEPAADETQKGPVPTEESGVSDGPLLLAEGKQSAYRVIISTQAQEDLLKIADEFVWYFAAVTGVTLTVDRDSTAESDKEILIGKTNRAEDDFEYETSAADTFCYKVCADSLLLTGSNTRAVAYAVYAFFEDVCGVRYWAPDYELIPQTDTLTVARTTQTTSSPVFSVRDLDGAGTADEKWMVKMRLNGRQSLGSENYRKTPFVGGGYGYAGWWVHTIAQLAEMEKGENGYWDVQPCLMDESVYQTVLKNVRAWLQENPDAAFVSVSQNDGDQNSMCRCERCRSFVSEHGDAESALWIYFVSRIANELKPEYPNVQFDTLSYTFTRKAPTGLTVPENVVVRIAPLRSCIRHGFYTCTQDDPLVEEMCASLEAWSELLGENFHVWEYDAFFNEYWSPNVNYSRLRENLKTYADLGVSGMFVQGDGSASNGFSELRAYLDAKLLWDPYMDDETFNEHLREFCEGYYGEGTAEPLMEYMRLINEKTEDSHYTIYSHAAEDYLPIEVKENANGRVRLDQTLLYQMQACFSKAENAVQDEQQQLHLKKAGLQVRYYELVCYHRVEEVYGITTYVPSRNEAGATLYTDAKKLGITQLMEGYWLSKTTTETWRHPLKWYKEAW